MYPINLFDLSWDFSLWLLDLPLDKENRFLTPVEKTIKINSHEEFCAFVEKVEKFLGEWNHEKQKEAILLRMVNEKLEGKKKGEEECSPPSSDG